MSSTRPPRPETGSSTVHPEASERFDEALRAWAGRPPRTEPAEAARRIAGRLPDRQPVAAFRLPLRLVVALAAAVLALGVGLAVSLAPERAPGRGVPDAGTTAPSGASLAPAGDLLVIELDPETTLYMNLNEGDPS